MENKLRFNGKNLEYFSLQTEKWEELTFKEYTELRGTQFNFIKGENRFEKMKVTHPKIYDYCINTLGMNKVLDFINVKY